jgi:hypothetical protein
VLINEQDGGEPVVGRGYHIALAREHAKRLFSIQDDASLRSFLKELIRSPEMKKSGRVLDTGKAWNAIHRCLTEGELDPNGGDFPLNHVVLGGKQLHKGDDYAAALVRPDMTTFVAEALTEVKEGDLREKFFALDPQSYGQPIDEKAFQQVWLALQNLKVFFDAAAENMEAVVFIGQFQE